MDKEVLARLNGINQEFYQTFAGSFSQTRRRIQPGVARIMQKLPREGNFLDIGCGNGNLANHWSREKFSGSFVGVDFSSGLIAAAGKNLSNLNPRQSVSFFQADLSRNDWSKSLPSLPWQAVFCFAVLHHIPSVAHRVSLCKEIRTLISKETHFWLSVWQPFNSPRLANRILPWSIVGLKEDDVEEGDVLMDWRAHQPEGNSPAIRFVHAFSEMEISTLAELAGFKVVESYCSDGREGNLGLYQRWVPEI